MASKIDLFFTVNINKAIIDDDDENESSDRSNESNDAVITHYKDLIREQVIIT